MKDQCVCITGSTHGIGFGIAEAFAKKGAKIVINSHEKDNGALDKLKKLTLTDLIIFGSIPLTFS